MERVEIEIKGPKRTPKKKQSWVKKKKPETRERERERRGEECGDCGGFGV